MTDWIYELTHHLYMREIAEKTGISQRKLREFYTGKRTLTSDLPEYEKLRNLNRRIAYQKLREAGATPRQARKHRRTLFDPYREEKESISTKLVNPERLPPDEQEKYQMRILGLYRHRKSNERKVAEGFSWAYSQKNESLQEEEAIRHGQAKLGSTEWEIEIILEKEWIIFKGGEGWEKGWNSERR